MSSRQGRERWEKLVCDSAINPVLKVSNSIGWWRPNLDLDEEVDVLTGQIQEFEQGGKNIILCLNQS